MSTDSGTLPGAPADAGTLPAETDVLIVGAGVSGLATALGALSLVTPRLLMADDPPVAPRNVLWIVVDDMGYGDLSSTGRTNYATPNIDRIARDGESGEDEAKRAEKELQQTTDRYVAQVDELVKHKETELLEV